MSVFIPPGKQQFFNPATGAPLAFGKVYHYIPSTSTPKDTWANESLTTLNTNPITLDANGVCIIWGNGLYRQRLLDAALNEIWDQVTGFVDGGSGGGDVFGPGSSTAGHIVLWGNTEGTSIDDGGAALGIAQGGTGLTSTPANGQLPIGNGTNYTLATLTAGTGITVTNGAGTITLDGTTPLTTKGDLMVRSSSAATRLAVGINGLSLVANSAATLGVNWALPLMADFVQVFGGVGDGTTSNNAALALAEASSYQRIWLPDGTYYTTTSALSLSKRYDGPGKLSAGVNSGAYQGTANYLTDVNTTVAEDDVPYGVGLSTAYSDVEYKTIAAGTRRNFDRYLHSTGNPNGYSTYFWAPASPKFTQFYCRGGWSGLSGVLASGVAIGDTVLTITGGTVGWTEGDTVGVTSDAQDGIPGDTSTIASVNTGAGTITLTTPLTHAYLAGAAVSNGYRTMNQYHLAVGEHSGGGDSYLWVGRITNAYVPLASQPSVFNTATVGIIGGDLDCTQDGQYMTAMEYNHSDGGNDVACNGLIMSFQRTNATGGRGAFWYGAWMKSEGSQPINGGFKTSGVMNLGLELTQGDFGANKGAIGMKLGDRVHFNMSTLTVGAYTLRGDIFPAIPMYLGSGNDGSNYIQFVNDTATLTVRPTIIEANKTLSVTGSISATASIAASGGVSGTTGTFSAGVSGTTGAFSGAVSGTTGTFSGAVSGTAGTFSGAVSGTTGTFSSAVSGTTGSFSAGVSGTTGTFSSTLTATAITGNGEVRGTSLKTQSTTGNASHILYFGDQASGASYMVMDTAAGTAALYIKGVQKASW